MNKEILLKQFNQLPKAKKISFIGLVCALLIVTAGLMVWQLTPDYRVLFDNLESQDASQIISRLETMKIPYRVAKQGRAVLVDKAHVQSLRLKLMGQGLVLKSGVGFELFDRSDFGMTEFSQKINYQRALQGELERTIASLDEVKSARVHLNLPEQRLFEQNNHPSAAVTLHLKPLKKLSPKQVSSIQQLIAASVAKLSDKDIVIVDENSNQLNAGSDEGVSEHLAAKKQIESYLTAKADKVLQSVFDEKVVVNVDVAINYDQVEKSSEQYLPGKHALVTHSKESKHSKTEKNKPASDDVTTEKFYQYGRMVEKKRIAAGNIEQLTISVVVPDNSDNAMRLKVEHLVKNAVGFNAKRGDSISVEAAVKTEPVSIIPSITINSNKPFNTQVIVLVSAVIIALLLVLGLVLHVRIASRRNRLLLELTQLIGKENVNVN